VTTAITEMELALAHLMRAKELAQFFGHEQELIERIDLLRRATIKVRGQLTDARKKAA
jgi:hypothetical protein